MWRRAQDFVPSILHTRNNWTVPMEVDHPLVPARGPPIVADTYEAWVVSIRPIMFDIAARVCLCRLNLEWKVEKHLEHTCGFSDLQGPVFFFLILAALSF
uniref:Uncharacterized protein n=1 Tax=Rhodosorus marinus TaxID=101924 RepID=A0A7S3EL11_9RHOD|mmetsp:Transcript_44463/g.172633  ORF Transcript_44463/g.172633 Transcript_44463/m.172633 type:complete len:100 (+) Transcript_44463:41-340(+)